MLQCKVNKNVAFCSNRGIDIIGEQAVGLPAGMQPILQIHQAPDKSTFTAFDNFSIVNGFWIKLSGWIIVDTTAASWVEMSPRNPEINRIFTSGLSCFIAAAH